MYSYVANLLATDRDVILGFQLFFSRKQLPLFLPPIFSSGVNVL